MSIWKKLSPDSFLLSNTVAHVWRAKLDYAENQRNFFSKNLSQQELLQAKRFVKKTDQMKYIITKAIQRDIIARYLNVTQYEVTFELGEHGKPYLSNNLLQFNLSHAGDWLLIGVTKSSSIGVDIECEKRKLDSLALAKRFFSEQEFQTLSLLSEIERIDAFYRMWTRKESFIKADGRGFAFPLNHFSVSATETDQNTLLEVSSDQADAFDWQINSIKDFPSRYYGAVTTKRTIKNFFYWDWT